MNYYKKKIERLEQEKTELKSQLKELVENPDSYKSMEIKSAIRMRSSFEKSVMFGTRT